MAIDAARRETLTMLRDSAADVADRADLSRVRALRFNMPGFSRAAWRRMGALGWLGLRVPEAAGGAGLGVVEQVALAEELGAALLPEPVICAQLALAALRGERRTCSA